MADQEDQPTPVAAQRQAWKREAAQAAVAREVTDGMIIGLGTGTTADIMLEALAERVRQGLRITGVATSERTRAEAQRRGISLADLDDVLTLHLSIDGADEVTLPTLDLVKGRGGALLREKLVAVTSQRRIIIVDDSKIVTTLASQHPVPVEVDRFGWRHTSARLAGLGATVQRRMASGDYALNAPFISDGGHYVLDCWFGPITQPGALATRIKAITGVIDHGLFVGMTERVYIAGPDGVQVYDRPQ
ncbi:MAG TPA: ribose-5-phosphate isomerase RpiA [Ktedonobacterales bacterium]|nr:ribose-5-phosphate isomerase RpiA [Ktedonobacterales bacterium]